MTTFNRRTFVQLSAGALLTTASSKLIAADKPAISSDSGTVKVKGANYAWQYEAATDRFTIFDARHRTIVSGRMQPAVVVASVDDPAHRICTAGKPVLPKVEVGKVTLGYEGVNGGGRLSISWRFDEHGIWMEPVAYEATSAQDVVSMHYFVEDMPAEDNSAGINEPVKNRTGKTPSLHPTYLVVPGALSGSPMSPVLHNAINLNQSFWLGRGSFLPSVTQQWALPVHYFCGFSTAWPGPERDMYVTGTSDAFTCGLADLPSGDLFIELHQGHASPWIDYRSDLWKHLRGPGSIQLGGTFLWTVAPDYYQSIAAYYEGLLQAGVIRKQEKSAHKTAVMLTPQFCTWGAQRARNKVNDKFDEASLTGIYKDLKASGMKAGLFSIDDKWEGTYGKLEHSAEKFPHFEQFLDQLRSDGMRIGVWAAIMRCEKPSDLGLTTDHMLKRTDGTPYLADGIGGTNYYILDFTQPEAAEALTSAVRRFMKRYKPDLFKFDFGYELPSLGVAAPKDKQWTGERMLSKGMEIVTKAMRAENPDIVVMYYNLSPLFLEYFDLHSPDDVYMDIGDYEIEVNRRLYFSSLLAKVGVPTYGSSGYDWASSPSVWFDSAAIGTIGSLNDFAGDEEGEVSTPDLMAKYNGITHLLRDNTNFEILPLDTVPIAPTFGAHARSWARFEDGQLVLLASRPFPVGEENPLVAAHAAKSKESLRAKASVQATGPVIVASKTNEDIRRSNHLGIVSYGGGEIVLVREQGKQAEITNHYFGGAMTHAKATIAGSQLKFRVDTHKSATEPLEWVEVKISG